MRGYHLCYEKAHINDSLIYFFIVAGSVSFHSVRCNYTPPAGAKRCKNNNNLNLVHLYVFYFLFVFNLWFRFRIERRSARLHSDCQANLRNLLARKFKGVFD